MKYVIRRNGMVTEYVGADNYWTREARHASPFSDRASAERAANQWMDAKRESFEMVQVK